MVGRDRDRWLSSHNEARYNLGIRSRPIADPSAFSCFLAVASRSHPLVPAAFTGPAAGLLSRVVTCWDARANPGSFLYEEKRQMAIATADCISRLEIANVIPQDRYHRLASGHDFFLRPSQPSPFEIPLSNAKPNFRAELNELLWILTILFHSVGVYFPPPPAPEGVVAYIPYDSAGDGVVAIPKRQRVASLAHAAVFFRRHAGLAPQQQVFSLFSFTRTSISPPKPEKTTPLSKSYYLQGSGVGAGRVTAKERMPLESGVSYFVAKLMEIRDAKEEVRPILKKQPIALTAPSSANIMLATCSTLISLPFLVLAPPPHPMFLFFCSF
jgi:hypothetical protein